MSTRDLFEENAEDYDRWYEENAEVAESEGRLVESLMSAAPEPRAEIGVGTGYFAKRAGVGIGIDPAAAMLRIARGRVEHLVRGTGEHLPLADSSLGSVLIVVTICFADDPRKMLEESFRVLRKGGIAVVCVVPRDSPLGELYIDLGRKGHRYYSRARFYGKSEVALLMREAGFEVVEALGTLRHGLKARVPEEPSRELEGAGFVCFKGVKR
ncbi:MAG: class I SAM-dependent methyltransferase [Acidilobaceae archaeon]|nr:class I SAM-dependent methyltransferase [Acidilobaceae archaeon]